MAQKASIPVGTNIITNIATAKPGERGVVIAIAQTVQYKPEMLERMLRPNPQFNLVRMENGDEVFLMDNQCIMADPVRL